MKRWKLSLAVILALVAGAGVWLWLETRPPQAQPVFLSDGTVIQLRGVTFGTNHVYPGGSLAQRLGRIVPQRLRQRLGLRAPNMQTTRPMLVVWTTARHPPNRIADPRYYLGGEGGLAPIPSSSTIRTGTPGGETIEGWGFEAFPRRGRTLTLRLYERQPAQSYSWQEMKLMGAFTLRNPARRQDAPWAPEPLPATRTNAEFTVTLKDFLVGAYTSNLQDYRVDYRLTLAAAVDDQGRATPHEGSSWSSGQHAFQLGVLTNATHLTLTLALHRSRYEEFRVKPERFEAR